jgi:exodeoxyribonuclease VII small subunit
MQLTFNQAYENLTELVSQLEDDNIQLDSLAEKVKQAKVLVEYCESKLRVIEGALRQAQGPTQVQKPD